MILSDLWWFIDISNKLHTFPQIIDDIRQIILQFYHKFS